MRRQIEVDRAKTKSPVDQATAQAQRALEQENRAKRIAEFHRQALNEKAPPAKANPAPKVRKREDDQLRDLAERYRVEAQKMQQELHARQASLEQALARERINVEQARAQAVQAQKQYEVVHIQLKQYAAKLKADQQDGPRAAGAQKARDEVELLKAQLQIKKAELDAAKASAEGTVRYSQQLEALRRSGAVQESLVSKAQIEAKVAMAQIRVKQAEVQAAEVALTQAMRRVEVLGGGATKAPAGGDREARLKELEGKLDALRKELQSLRQGQGSSKKP